MTPRSALHRSLHCGQCTAAAPLEAAIGAPHRAAAGAPLSRPDQQLEVRRLQHAPARAGRSGTQRAVQLGRRRGSARPVAKGPLCCAALCCARAAAVHCWLWQGCAGRPRPPVLSSSSATAQLAHTLPLMMRRSMSSLEIRCAPTAQWPRMTTARGASACVHSLAKVSSALQPLGLLPRPLGHPRPDRCCTSWRV